MGFMTMKGFTLVEVLFVTALIGVLAVLALQNYFGWRNEAYEKDVLSIHVEATAE
jgi:prepilin-type N-terminal cleavage/methylation domain-containing protein